jgi:hypothetical protein
MQRLPGKNQKLDSIPLLAENAAHCYVPDHGLSSWDHGAAGA